MKATICADFCRRNACTWRPYPTRGNKWTLIAWQHWKKWSRKVNTLEMHRKKHHTSTSTGKVEYSCICKKQGQTTKNRKKRGNKHVWKSHCKAILRENNSKSIWNPPSSFLLALCNSDAGIAGRTQWSRQRFCTAKHLTVTVLWKDRVEWITTFLPSAATSCEGTCSWMTVLVENLSFPVLEITTGPIKKLLMAIRARKDMKGRYKSLKIVKPKCQRGGVFLGTMGQRFPWLTPLESVEQCQETTGSHLCQ